MKQLIQEKLDQTAAILNEFNVDVWLTFVRETSLMPDPALELIAGLDFTWQSAFLLARDGRRRHQPVIHPLAMDRKEFTATISPQYQITLPASACEPLIRRKTF